MPLVVAQKLKGLRRRDRRRRIFGADSHRWRLKRIAPSEIVAFENKIGVALPQEYRDHLIGIGSGAGPYYGLYSIDEVEREWAEMCAESFTEDWEAPDPSRPFLVPQDKQLSRSTPIDVKAYAHGVITIGHQGSGTQWTWLATAGPWAGCVWDLGWFAGLDAQTMPARVPPATLPRIGRTVPAPPQLPMPPTFAEWFETWLDYSHTCLDDAL